MGRIIKSKDDLIKMDAYELVHEEKLTDLNSLGLLFRHKKTGARVLVISNDDDNKVFSIGFRTPPENSTGVPHIIEHSVLCGSKEFPSKDPFVELVKGSLNTFLNAMTYSDKTLYPIASCNEKDYKNLMHVYMDAVFYPNIYNREEIFKQEGWHYELDSVDGELTYNGVVYNEMKGVFSSPEQQLFRQIQQSLFPDTTYGVESGGDPANIPDLSYEQFLDFHKRYYHPSNSYIYLYGDIDVEERLNWMDENYLSKFEEAPIDSTIKKQAPFGNMHEITEYYSLAENESTEEKTYFSYNAVIGTSLDRELYLAFQIVDYVLLSAPGAPLKQALISAGIGKDILSSYDNGILQPYFSIIAKNAKTEDKERFLTVIKETLEKIASEGIDEKPLRAAINYYEFKYREADFGSYPKGLMYGLQILDSWLYDDKAPFIHIEANDTFKFLKEQIGTGYYEQLIRTYLLENDHTSMVVIEPKVGLTNEVEQAVKEKLAAYKATLSKKELEKLVKDTVALKEFQDTPSTKEELELIPMLEREDITTKAGKLYNEVKEAADVTVLHHNMFSNGIGYLRLLFDVNDVEEELVPYMSLLSTVLGYIDTNKHSFMEFANEVNIHTGGIVSDVTAYSVLNATENYTVKFGVKTKVLYDKVGTAFDLIKEMLFESKLDDYKRLKEIVAEQVSRSQMKVNSAGHSYASVRAMSYSSVNAKYNDLTGGIAYYEFLKELDEHFEERKEDLVAKLSGLLTRIIRKDNLLVSYTADDQGYILMAEELGGFVNDLRVALDMPKRAVIKTEVLNEGFKTSSQVQYVARGGNFIEKGYKYTGALKILKVILSYDYLWINIRVKGGAYGCMGGFGLDGNSYLASYRDPNLMATNEIFNNTAEYLKTFSVDERDMTKYIIGTISGMDTPMNPSAKGSRSLGAYLSGVTELDLQRERDEVLSATEQDIRDLADIVQAVLDADQICVIGNENKIEEDKELFKEIKTL
ncbi:MAG: insulinase family protein [bacterium]|nr:insulinase family protein [bacterium]